MTPESRETPFIGSFPREYYYLSLNGGKTKTYPFLTRRQKARRRLVKGVGFVLVFSAGFFLGVVI